VDADWALVLNKSGATRLGFALLLRFFELEARLRRLNRRRSANRMRHVGKGGAPTC